MNYIQETKEYGRSKGKELYIRSAEGHSFYEDFDEYIKTLEGTYSQEELNEMKEIANEEMQKGNVDWREYVTYTRIDVHPDPEGSKMGRAI